MTEFGNTPNFENCYDGDNSEYLGTWFGLDCYVVNNDSLLIRHGNEDHEYGSEGNVGWNPYAADCKVGGLGNGRHPMEIAIQDDCRYSRAKMAALAFLGRRSLNGR